MKRLLLAKDLTKAQKEILENGTLVKYTCKNDLGNFLESAIVKYNSVVYIVELCNKFICEFRAV